MRKIFTLFVRSETTPRLVTREPASGVEWVFAGEGVATVKWDGSCCLIREGVLYRRHTTHAGRPTPAHFVLDGLSDTPGNYPGWVPCDRADPADQYHWLAFDAPDAEHADWTYELVGPKVQGNPYQLSEHRLVPHGRVPLPALTDRSYDGIATFLRDTLIEGIVFWRDPTDPRSDMGKIKRRDLALAWPEDPPTLPLIRPVS